MSTERNTKTDGGVRSFGAIAAGITGGKQPRRSFQPVRRNSQHAGEREVRAWKQHNVFDARERRARLKAAVRFDEDSKQPGKPWGALGPNGIKVYKHILKSRDFKTGRFDQSAQTIATALRISRQTVHAALRRLKVAGLVDWLRRTRPVEAPEPFGPQVEQISNAYLLPLPKWLRNALARMLAPPPVPADAAWAIANDAAETRKMLDGLSLPERVDATVSDPGLAAVLRALGSGVERTENASKGSRQNPDPGCN